MTQRTRDPRYYVVGGPVQPGRACYVSRVADAELLRRVSDGDYCHVLAQRQVGKTSLAAATAAKLRAAGCRVAMVDLTRASAEYPSANAGRWYYSIAYRIVRDLRIREDLQNWWAERGGLTTLQRLREFFLDFVLSAIDGSVVIFIDRVEVTMGEPLARDLFAAVRACHDARATDSEFERLTFVLLGSAAAEELVRPLQDSPFSISSPVDLPDFSAQETASLLTGLGEPLADAEAIALRVWSWTRGHPYLSQKLYRGLARRKEPELSPATVDERVQLQFLKPKALTEEPHLAAIAQRLLQHDPGRTARLNLYGRIRKGIEVTAEPHAPAQQALLTIGIVVVSPQGRLRVRNDIYAVAFSTRWVNQQLPMGWRALGVAAVFAVILLALPVWYSEYLPRPYIEALSAPNQDLQVARDAHASLARLPGFGVMADRLYTRLLENSVQQSTRFSEIMRIVGQLEDMPEGSRRVAESLAAFWHRRALTSMHAGQRDAALLAVLESLKQPNTERRQLAAELIGEDYPHLLATLRTAGQLQALAVDETNETLTVLDSQHGVYGWDLSQTEPVLKRRQQLLAEQQLELQQRRQFTALPPDLRLLVQLRHARPADIRLTLQAPSGREAVLLLTAGEVVSNNLYAFDFNRFAALEQLASAEISGNWSLRAVDRQQGVLGELEGWTLTARRETALAPGTGLPQPLSDPRQTSDAETRLDRLGQRALAWPADSTAAGPVLVWDLMTESVLARLPRPEAMTDAVFALQGERVLLISPRRIDVRDSQSGAEDGQIALDPAVSPELQLSADGRFAALRTLTAAGELAVEVWDLRTVQRLGEPIPNPGVSAKALDSSGSRIAIGGRDGWARVWSLPEGTLEGEFEHSAPVRALWFDASGRWLASDDMGYTLRVWDSTAPGRTLLERRGSSPWLLTFAADSRGLLAGSDDRAYEYVSLPDLRSSGAGFQHATEASRDLGDYDRRSPLLLTRADLAVTATPERGVKLWRLSDDRKTMPLQSYPRGAPAALSTDGQRIALGLSARDVRLHADGAPGRVLLSPAAIDIAAEGSTGAVCLAFAPDRNWLASGGMDGEVRVWNAVTGQPGDYLISHPDGPVLDLLFTPDGRNLVSASRNEVLYSAVADGRILGRLQIQANRPQLAVAAATGRVFIADDQRGVTAWDGPGGTAERLLSSELQIEKIAVDSSGEKLVTADASSELSLWQATGRIRRGMAVKAAARVDRLWMSDDGRGVLVQAGHWLQSFSISSTGLEPSATRLLAAAPVVVQPDGAEAAWLLSYGPGRRVLDRIVIDQPPLRELEGELQGLRASWSERLSLELTEAGEIVPRRPPVP